MQRALSSAEVLAVNKERWQDRHSSLKVAMNKYMSSLPQELLIGVPSVDTGHLELVTLLDKLANDPSVHLESARFSEIISQLLNLMVEHFADEEVFLKTCGMPRNDVAAHIQAHHKIIEQYAQLNYGRMGGKDHVLSEISEVVKGWIVGHLLEYDTKIRPYVTG
jgi:hemerythrin-like metal-binding protein